MKDEASSEIIGSLALAFIFVGGAALVLVLLSSQYPPVSVPNIQVDISFNKIDNTLYFRSAGGDYREGTYLFQVYEDGNIIFNKSINTFPTGTIRNYPLPISPNVRKVLVIFRDPKTSSEYVIASKNITTNV
mgnify:CR=1 FL=1